MIIKIDEVFRSSHLLNDTLYFSIKVYKNQNVSEKMYAKWTVLLISCLIFWHEYLC